MCPIALLRHICAHTPCTILHGLGPWFQADEHSHRPVIIHKKKKKEKPGDASITASRVAACYPARSTASSCCPCGHILTTVNRRTACAACRFLTHRSTSPGSRETWTPCSSEPKPHTHALRKRDSSVPHLGKTLTELNHAHKPGHEKGHNGRTPVHTSKRSCTPWRSPRPLSASTIPLHGAQQGQGRGPGRGWLLCASCHDPYAAARLTSRTVHKINGAASCQSPHGHSICQHMVLHTGSSRSGRPPSPTAQF